MAGVGSLSASGAPTAIFTWWQRERCIWPRWRRECGTKALASIGLPSVADHAITGMNQLERELKEIMAKGYAFEDQEFRMEVMGVVAPIYDSRNRLTGCVGAAAVFSLEINDRKGLGWQIPKIIQQILS